MKIDTRGITNGGVRPLHLDQLAQRQSGLLGFDGCHLSREDIFVKPNVVADSRLREVSCQNQRLFEFEADADVNEIMDTAYRNSPEQL